MKLVVPVPSWFIPRASDSDHRHGPRASTTVNPQLSNFGGAPYLRAMLRVFPPGFILPAQPVRRPGPPCGSSWVHEIKHDGFRLIILKGADVRLFTRSGNDWTDRFPLITKAARKLRGSFLIDGEAVVVGPDGPFLTCSTSQPAYAARRWRSGS
jgi:hypothetical protein